MKRPLQAEAILETAARVFAARGFAGASMADLARECGVSKALLYHYYPGKEEILHDLTRRYVARLNALCDEVAAQSLPPREHLAVLVRAFLGEYQSSQYKHMVLTRDTTFLEPAHRRAVVKKQRAVVEAFRRAIAAAVPERLTPESALPAAMMLFGMINWTFTWLRPGGPMSYADFADWVIRVLEGGLGNLAPAADPGPRARAPARTPARTPARATPRGGR